MKQIKHLNLIMTHTIIIIIIVLVYFNNKRIYSEVHNLIEEDKIDSVSLTYNNDQENIRVDIDASENATYIEVNHKGYVVDNIELFKIMSKYKCKRSKTQYFPYAEDDVIANISIYQNHKPKNILLGDFNIWYESADKKVYDIIDGDKLLQEILVLVKNKET